MDVARLAEIYSKFGLEEMIKHAQESIEKKKREREDVGMYWTPIHIKNYQRTLDEEISMLENNIKEFEEALALQLQEA